MNERVREENCACRRGVTRRGFLTAMGTGAIVAGASGTLLAKESGKAETAESDAMTPLNLLINGHGRKLLIEPRWSLLYVLREKLGLTGTKVGCERGECGACTVLIDSIPHYACLMLALEAEGREIVTLEGLMNGEDLGPVQQAFLEHDAYQCGYCTPGQVMAIEGLLRKTAAPTPEQVQVGVSGNLCRCGAYVNIFQAAGRAAELKAGKRGGA